MGVSLIGAVLGINHVFDVGGGDGLGVGLEFGTGIFVGDGVATTGDVGSLGGASVGVGAGDIVD